MRSAAMRNIVFERHHFETHFLGNPAKAETHRICHENSEDALTWNVFARLARARALAKVLSTLSTVSVGSEPELYLWGLRVRLMMRPLPPRSLRWSELATSLKQVYRDS